jgi:hypothetical protein
MRRTAGPRQIPQAVHVALAHMVGAGGVCDPYSPPLIFGGIQALEGLHVYFDFHSLVHSVIAKFKGPRRIQAWQCALACSTCPDAAGESPVACSMASAA